LAVETWRLRLGGFWLCFLLGFECSQLVCLWFDGACMPEDDALEGDGPVERLERTDTNELIAVGAAPLAYEVLVQDDEGLRRFQLAQNETFVVGSSRCADIRVHDRAVSARHCELRLVDGYVLLADTDSKNGTYAGTARVARATCGGGAVITVGTASIEIYASPGTPVDEGDTHATKSRLSALPGMLGDSIVMRAVAAQVRRFARLSAPVLIVGETGTGKELVARALHSEGPRRTGPFIPLNVASLPKELVESELFGHERGAFTGAVQRREGAFQEAENGTLFLDEIGELPLEAQPKLLRALDGYEVRRVGGAKGAPSKARVVAATHVALAQGVEHRAFRRDLFHRLEVFVVRLPALRERRGDIVPIAKSILRNAESELGARMLASDAAACLSAQDWPGNVRELRNVLCRAADFAADHTYIRSNHVNAALTRPFSSAAIVTPRVAQSLLKNHGNNMSAAARAAGLPRTSFRKLLST
jgi:Sigma-54 interaction domain/Inner membrane component of T3SS, cytoplasmic domain